MTTKERIRLPDPPEIPRMTSFDRLHRTGNTHNLAEHFGNEKTTIVGGERHISAAPTSAPSGRIIPDLLIAFGVDPRAYEDSRGYVIAEQGKPPDFVLEIASRRTGRVDVGQKRIDYAALGIPEYWRFDETGEFHRARLAGDRLAAGGQYQSIPIEEVAEGVLQGYSPVLNLHIRWENGQLRWHDPETGQHIPTFDGEREARMRAQDEIREEREVLRREREARLLAEARVRELEERLESQGNQ
jgi:Uma2 family endonuclease